MKCVQTEFKNHISCNLKFNLLSNILKFKVDSLSTNKRLDIPDHF